MRDDTTPATAGATIEDYLAEERTFPPSGKTRSEALVNDDSLYTEAADRLRFWDTQARALTWFEPWETTLEWELPFAKWFVGGKLNVSYNCLDRHVEAGLGDRVAITSRASRATGARSRMRRCWRKSGAAPTRCAASAWSAATGWRSTCR